MTFTTDEPPPNAPVENPETDAENTGVPLRPVYQVFVPWLRFPHLSGGLHQPVEQVHIVDAIIVHHSPSLLVPIAAYCHRRLGETFDEAVAAAAVHAFMFLSRTGLTLGAIYLTGAVMPVWAKTQ